MINIRTTFARKLCLSALAIPQKSAICFSILIPIGIQGRVTQDWNSSVWDKNKGSWECGEQTASASESFLSFLITLALYLCFQVTLPLLLQLMKISASSMFWPTYLLLLLQFLQISLLPITYTNLRSPALLCLFYLLTWHWLLLLPGHSIFVCVWLRSLQFFWGFSTHCLKEAITNNSFHLLNFSQIPVVTQLVKSI